jgi:hypothetical protein
MSVINVGDTAATDPEMPLRSLVDGQKRGEGRVVVTPREPFHHSGLRPPLDVADAPDDYKRTAARRGSVKVWPHSLKGWLDATATEARSSRSVSTWNNSSAPRGSTLT